MKARWVILGAELSGALVAASFVACVGDAPVTVPSDAGADARDAAVDAPEEACLPPANVSGVFCVDQRCKTTEFCCMSLAGGGQIKGTCLAAGTGDAGPAQTCGATSSAYIECAKALDCPKTSDRCCGSTEMFSTPNMSTCPGTIPVAMSEGGGATPPSCQSTPCGGPQLCATDQECGGKRCVPVTVSNAQFGMCMN